MKKYFIAGTEKEVKFGDELEADFSKELPNGRVRHQHIECVFAPELAELFVEKGVLEEKEDDEEKEFPFNIKEAKDECLSELLDEIVNLMEDFNVRLSSLEKKIASSCKSTKSASTKVSK